MSLVAENLGVSFDGDWVFRGVSFRVGEGDRIALVGPSGSGKSLLLKCLALLQNANEGHVNWSGQKISGHAVPRFRSEVMYVPQRAAVVDGSVGEFLKLPFSFAVHSQKSWSHDKAESLLKPFGRNVEFLRKSHRDLSGGEHQMVTIARSLLLNPVCLLLDEPTSAMDDEAKRAAEELISNWCGMEASRSFVWITHDSDQAERIADKVIQMKAW